MEKAYDIILQLEISAIEAVENCGFEPYRYECCICHEEVYVAASFSANQSAHFRHKRGNNDTECEKYLGQFNVDTQSIYMKKSKRERAEFYYNSNNQTFDVSLSFTEAELQYYEKADAELELRVKYGDSTKPFRAIKINHMNFAADTPVTFPLTKYTRNYYLSITTDEIRRKYEVFKSENMPTFFKIQGNDENFRAKLIRGGVLFTNTPYFVVFQEIQVISELRSFSTAIKVDKKISFETMNQRFYGVIFEITKKNVELDVMLQKYEYHLESSESVNLLWPPAATDNEIYLVESCEVYLSSSFYLKAHGNINVEVNDIRSVEEGISQITIKQPIKIYRKNSEMTIDIKNNAIQRFQILEVKKIYQKMFTVPACDSYYLFDCDGTTLLVEGQIVYMTENNWIIHYEHNYPIERIVWYITENLCGRNLLEEILSYYKVYEVFTDRAFHSLILSKVAQSYINECKIDGIINSAVKKCIEDGSI